MNRFSDSDQQNRATFNFFSFSIQIEREFYTQKVAPIFPIVAGCVGTFIGLLALAYVTSHLNPARTSQKNSMNANGSERSILTVLKPASHDDRNLKSPLVLKVN